MGTQKQGTAYWRRMAAGSDWPTLSDPLRFPALSSALNYCNPNEPIHWGGPLISCDKSLAWGPFTSRLACESGGLLTFLRRTFQQYGKILKGERLRAANHSPVPCR
jgi:hypothetical protein